jgi:hypothetical protein
MSTLEQLQANFQQYILSGESDIIHSILSTKEVSADKRLSIYRDAYGFRLIECLATNFPSLHSYLGTEEFHNLCRSFIHEHPSSFRSIRWFGDALADFIKKYYTTRYAFLAELADFEWKMTLAFDAEDASVVKIEDMAAVPADAWGDLSFSVHPSAQRVNYSWNVIPLWQALAADEELPSMNESTIKPWLIWRNQDYLIKFYSLSQEEAWMLDGIKQGLSFAASYLKSWIQKGILSQLHY